MSEDSQPDTVRRKVLKLAALAGLPFAAGNAAAATDDGDSGGSVAADRRGRSGTGRTATASGNHLGETWSGSPSSGHGLKVDVSGGNDGLVGETDSGFGVRGLAQSSDGATSIGVYGFSSSTSGEGVWGEVFASSGDTKGVYGFVNSPDGYGVYGEAGDSNAYGVYSDGDLHVQGDFTASGTKNFVQTVDTPDGPKNVAYTAVEADRAQTETTGVTELADGRAEIDLPEHFGMVTSEAAELVVQLTPYEVDAPTLAVTERSTDRIVVESADGTGDVEFSYTVRGTRSGYEDEQVVSDADEDGA